MALPAYSSDRHHIGLGVDADNLKGFFVRGYTKSRQRETDRVVQEFGGGHSFLGWRTTLPDALRFHFSTPALFASSLD